MKLNDRYLRGGAGLAPHAGEGIPWLPSLIGARAGFTLAEAKLYPRADLVDGMAFTIDGAEWRYSASSALAADDILTVELETTSTGRLLRQPGFIELSLPFTFATADGASLYTMPSGAIIKPLDFYWSVAVGLTGGVGSAIGVSSTKVGYNTAGDLLGGATGDVAATLVPGARILGTVGTTWGTTAERRALFVAGDAIRFNRIASAFTAGSGAVKIPALLLAHAGA